MRVIFDALTPIITVISNILKTLINTIKNIINTIISVAGGILSVIAKALNAIAPILEALMHAFGFDWLEEVPTWARVLIGVFAGGLSEGAHFISTGHFANGGFPEDGFFFANHNELIGQFSNGQTAVANNQQITEGIYKAVRDAMKESGGNQNVVVKIDSYELAKVINKRQNNFGANVIFGDNLNWGK